MSAQAWTLGVAISGLGLGVLNFVWSIYKEVRSKPKLRVDATVGWSQDRPAGYAAITVTNLRSRPITVTECGVEMVGAVTGDKPFYDPSLPRLLKDSEQLTVFSNPVYISGKECKRLFAKDTTGNRWYAKQKPPEMYESFQKMMADFETWAKPTVYPDIADKPASE